VIRERGGEFAPFFLAEGEKNRRVQEFSECKSRREAAGKRERNTEERTPRKHTEREEREFVGRIDCAEMGHSSAVPLRRSVISVGC
jgi:hypothetical protein